ncbi:MAG: MarR family transcriptional regulator [Mycobacteriaceae bacterium]
MPPSVSPASEPTDTEVDAVMHAARVLVAVVASSLSAVESVVTVTQLRILMLVATRESMNLSAVAEALRVHASNASRACDRLVRDKLLERRDSTTDRRNLVLELSPQGRELVESVVESRRAAMRAILTNMSVEDRARLAPVLNGFAVAAGEHPDHDFATPIWGD